MGVYSEILFNMAVACAVAILSVPNNPAGLPDLLSIEEHGIRIRIAFGILLNRWA